MKIGQPSRSKDLESMSISSLYGSYDTISESEILSSDRTVDSDPAQKTETRQNLNFMHRELPRFLWQKDSDAPVCSMMLCKNSFQPSRPSGFVFLPISAFHGHRRHHCRQCGRVVCSDCSKGCKYLTPTHPSSSSKPTLRRVCDACLHSSDTFDFKPPDFRSNYLSSTNSSRAPVSRSTQHLRIPMPSEKLCLNNEAGTLKAEGQKICCIKNVCIPSDDDQKSQAETPVLVNALCAAMDASTKAIRSSSPLRIPSRGGQSLAGRELEASSYYHGLLQHEPAALHFLLAAALERHAHDDASRSD